ncbi:MAG: hypothetical protein LBK67_13610 [Coriobacteriales bacterium]|nr:hypothetical protein [Coriobacteriales bacterium]
MYESLAFGKIPAVYASKPVACVELQKPGRILAFKVRISAAKIKLDCRDLLASE